MASEDADGWQDVADELHQQVINALIEQDRASLADLGGQTARLQRVAIQAGAQPELVTDLRRIARTIEISWTTSVMADSRHEPPTPPQFTVRARVRAELRAGPKRPRELATTLGLDRTQVSRALRQLEQAGEARHVRGAVTSDDQRAAVWTAI